MRRHSSPSIHLFLATVILAPFSVNSLLAQGATEALTPAAPVIIGPEFFGLDPLEGYFWNPSATIIGDRIYLYIHGNLIGVSDEDRIALLGPHDPSMCGGDKILLFTAPTSSFSSTFDWEYEGIVSPCDSFHYGLGGVHKLPGRNEWVMFADKVEDVAATMFPEVSYSRSQNGEDWGPFERLIYYDAGGHNIYDVTLTGDAGGSAPGTIFTDGFESGNVACWSYVEGGVQVGTCPPPPNWIISRGVFRFDASKVGAIRVAFDDPPQSEFVNGVRVWVKDDGRWIQLDDATLTMDFVPDEIWGVSAGETLHPNSITQRNGTFELWAAQTPTPFEGGGCEFEATSTFLFRSFDPWNGTVGSNQYVFSLNRPMPSKSFISRASPARIDVGGDHYLFSGSQDRNCTYLQNECSENPVDSCVFVGMYTVLTKVTYD